MFDKKVSKITHLSDAPPLLCPLKCLTRPGVRPYYPPPSRSPVLFFHGKAVPPLPLLALIHERRGSRVLSSLQPLVKKECSPKSGTRSRLLAGPPRLGRPLRRPLELVFLRTPPSTACEPVRARA